MCNKLDKEWTEAGFQILRSDWLSNHNLNKLKRKKIENQTKS